jgi:hypothetical protein
MFVFGQRPGPGRARSSSQTLASVSTRVPPEHLDRLIKLAEADRISVSEYLRRVVVQTTEKAY